MRECEFQNKKFQTKIISLKNVKYLPCITADKLWTDDDDELYIIILYILKIGIQ